MCIRDRPGTFHCLPEPEGSGSDQLPGFHDRWLLQVLYELPPYYTWPVSYTHLDVYKRQLYGSMIFSDRIMRNKLPKDVYKALRKTIENGTHLELDVANSVAVSYTHLE